jgi:hypothetical protein
MSAFFASDRTQFSHSVSRSLVHSDRSFSNRTPSITYHPRNSKNIMNNHGRSVANANRKAAKKAKASKKDIPIFLQKVRPVSTCCLDSTKIYCVGSCGSFVILGFYQIACVEVALSLSTYEPHASITCVYCHVPRLVSVCSLCWSSVVRKVGSSLGLEAIYLRPSAASLLR